MPISNAQGCVVGVAQFVNKLDGTAFNRNDENLFEVTNNFLKIDLLPSNRYICLDESINLILKQRHFAISV